MNVEEKRQHEKQVLTTMCKIYCQGNHGQELLDYALFRTDKCPFMETKTFCSACKVHCYTKEKQEKIRQVMKYAGSRMLPVHPILTIRHGMVTMKSVRQKKKDKKQ